MLEETVDKIEEPKIESDRATQATRAREVLHQAYRVGFELQRELCKVFAHEERGQLVEELVDLAGQWMVFVEKRCERGRGLKPRWACQASPQ